MMKKNFYIAVVLILMALISGCARGGATAPPAASGEKTEIILLSHRGNPASMDERQYQFRVEVGQWMERDLLNMLRRSGYEARQINSRTDFTPKAGRYLLEVTIDSYNPGSSAARIVVGFGAGAAALDNSYALSAGQQPLLVWSDGVGTSQHWTRLPRVLNERAVKKVTEYLKENK
jgi:hypothetical protein